MPKSKTDARPSDTKSVVLNKSGDRRLLDHLQTVKSESAFWRHSAYFYLDFMEWLATQPDPPEPDQDFIHYRLWLERRPPPEAGGVGGGLDPDTIATAILPGVRTVVEAALSTALAGLSLPPSPAGGEGGEEVEELADLFSSELVLE